MGTLHTFVAGEGVIVEYGVLANMCKQVSDAKAAIKAIYDYAVTTKNVSRLLKEKSGAAIKHLGSLTTDLELARKGSGPANEMQATNMRGQKPGLKKKVRDVGTQASTVAARDERLRNLSVRPTAPSRYTGVIEFENRPGKRKEISPVEQRKEKIQRRRKDLGGDAMRHRLENETQQTWSEDSPQADSDEEEIAETEIEENEIWQRKERKKKERHKTRLKETPGMKEVTIEALPINETRKRN